MGDDKEKQAPKKIDLTSPDAEKNLGGDQPAAKASPEAKTEVVDKRQEAITGAKTKALEAMKASAVDIASIKAMAETGANMSSLQTYFEGQINRFDKDKDGKISEAEAKEYQAKMVEKTNNLMKEFKEADAKKKEVTEAAGKVEKMDSEKMESELGDIKEMSDKGFEASMKEFEKMQTQNAAFQQQIGAKIDEIAEFGKSVGEFNKKRAGFNAFVHAAKEFRDLFSSGPSEDTQELNEMQAKLDSMKASANQALASLKLKKTTLEANGKIIQAAVEAERARLIKERDDKTAEVEAAQEEHEEKIKEKKEQYKKLDERKKELEKRKGQLEQKQNVTNEAQSKWEKQTQNEKLDVRKQDYTTSANDALLEIEALEMMGKDPAVGPEGKAELDKAIEKVKERYRRTQAGIELIDQRGEKEKKIRDEFKDQKDAALQEINSTSAVLNGQISPAIESLDTTIANMEVLKLQYATSAVEVKEFYNKEVEKKDKLADAVSDNLLTSSISRNKSLDALSSAVKTLDTVTLESSGFLGSLLKLPQGLLEGIGGALHDLSKWIDNNTSQALQDCRDTNNSFLGVVVQGLSFFSGFLSGGLECIGGVFNLAAHPIEGLKGLSALVGFDAKNGRFSADTFVDSWKNLGKAIIGYDEWEKGNYGSGAGKLTFNVLSMFVGVGEAGAGSKAAVAATIAKDSAIAVAKAAGKEIGMLTGRGAAMMAFVKSLASSAVKSIKPQFITKAQIASGKAAGLFGKTVAIGKSLAVSAYEGVKAGFNYFRKQPMEFTKEVGGKMVTEVKDARPFLVDLVNGAKGVGKLYGTLMLSPWLVLKGFGNGLKGLVKLGKGASEAGLLSHYKAGKAAEAARVIEVEGANFGKAQNKIAELIEHDPELSELAKAGPEGRAKAEGHAALKLLDTEPELATSYAKVRQATETLDTFNQYMAKKANDSVTETLKDPDLKYAHDEFNRLETNRDLAVADHKIAGQKLGPEMVSFYDNPPAKILDTNKASRIKKHVDSAGGQAGWSTGQKAFMEDYMLRSPELDKAPLGSKSAGNSFTREMQTITDDFATSKKAVPEMSELEAFQGAKNDVKAANAELNRFTSRPSNVDKVQKYTEAKTKTDHLNDLIDQQKKLYEGHAQPGPELAAMEAEVGEARAMAGEMGPNGEYPRPSIKDDPAFMEGAHDRFVDAVKAGDLKAIESAKGDFGIYSKKSNMGKSLDAIEQATLESATAKADRAQAIAEFDRACASNPDVAAVRDRFSAALHEGNLTALETIRKEVGASSSGGYHSAAVSGPDIIKGLDALEMEYRVNPSNLIETYRNTARDVKRFYDAYNTALQEGKMNTVARLKKLNPEWAKALEQLESRQKFLDKHFELSQEIAAESIGVQLDSGSLIKPGMTEQEVADMLYKQSAGLRQSSRLNPAEASYVASKEIVVREISVGGNKYKVVMNAQGEARLMKGTDIIKTTTELAEEARIAKAPKAAPAKPAAAPAGPAVAPTATPSAGPAASPAPAPVLKTHDTATLAEPLTAIPDEATVAYGTMSPGGHWVEVTKLKTGEYLVVEVQGGKAVSETTMSKLELFDEGSQHVLRGLKNDGTVYEYANIHETFKPSTYATKPDLVFPAAPVSPTAGPAVAPAGSPAAGPAKGPSAAAPAGPKPLSTRRAELDAEIATAKAELEIKKNALLDARKRLDPIEKAYTRAQAGGDTVKINTLKTKYESQLAVVQGLEGEVTSMGSAITKKQLEWTKLSAARGGEIVIDRLASPLRSEWVKKKLDALSKIPGIPGRAFGLLKSAYIEIGNYARAKNLYKIIEYSKLAMPSLREIWKATKGQSSAEVVIKGLLGEHIKDLQDLQQLSLDNLGNLSVEDQIEAIEKSWDKAKKVAGAGGFSGGGTALNNETLYSDSEQDYIKDKRENLMKIIEEVIDKSPENISKADLEKLIGDRLGAELNDTNKVYEITVDGIKIRVDKEGKRTFDGTDKWIADRPKKKAVGLAFKDTDGTFGDLNTRKMAKLNGGKAPADIEEYKKIVTEHLKKQIIEKLGDQDVSKGLTVYSKGRTESGAANFTAKFNEKGELTVEIHQDWLNKTYEASKVVPKPVAKAKPKPEPYDYAGEPSPKVDTAAAPSPTDMPVAQAPKEGDDVSI